MKKIEAAWWQFAVAPLLGTSTVRNALLTNHIAGVASLLPAADVTIHL
jgi:hypothetical protein